MTCFGIFIKVIKVASSSAAFLKNPAASSSLPETLPATNPECSVASKSCPTTWINFIIFQDGPT